MRFFARSCTRDAFVFADLEPEGTCFCNTGVAAVVHRRRLSVPAQSTHNKCFTGPTAREVSVLLLTHIWLGLGFGLWFASHRDRATPSQRKMDSAEGGAEHNTLEVRTGGLPNSLVYSCNAGTQVPRNNCSASFDCCTYTGQHNLKHVACIVLESYSRYVALRPNPISDTALDSGNLKTPPRIPADVFGL